MRSPGSSSVGRRLLTSTTALLVALGVSIGAAAAAPRSVDAVEEPVGGEALAAAGVVVDLGPGALAPPETAAASYLVADLDTGQVLAAKAAHQQLPPASTLKMLTALVLLPALDKEQVVVGTDEEMMVEGSKVGIETGLSYSVDLLFKAMLLGSGNDATHALARVGGGVERTVAAMNALAVELRAFDTVVVGPAGLDEPGQVTSAYDLGLIGRAAFEREDFRTYSTTPTADLPTQDGATYQIQNGNRLLGAYDGLIGGKNGFTTLARHTYVGAAERDGRAYLVTVMRTDGRAEAVAAALLDWAFLNADAVEPVGELVDPASVPVISAAPPTSDPARAPGETPADANPSGTHEAAGDPADGGLGAMTTVGLLGVGIAGAVAGLRIRAVRRERLRRRRLHHRPRVATRPPG